MRPILEKTGLFTELPLAFADFLSRTDPAPEVYLLGALISRAVMQNHIGVPVAVLLNDFSEELKSAGFSLELPDSLSAIGILRKSPVCSIDPINPEYRPLVLDQERLYLERYFRYETILATRLKSMAVPVPLSENQRMILEESSKGFSPRKNPEESLFGSEPDYQRAALFLACTRKLAVLSGGPGTGKTTALKTILKTILKIEPGLKIFLTAPTGKAASRMDEVIGGEIPVAWSGTLHRLIGPLERSMDAKPIDADILVIDEASMVSLPWMARTLERLPERSRLILLGDKNQLSSVEAGAFFADITSGSPVFSHSFTSDYRRITGEALSSGADTESTLMDSRIELLESRRFPENSLIGKLSRLVLQGTPESAKQALDLMHRESGKTDSTGITVNYHPAANRKQVLEILRKISLEGYRPYLEAQEPEEALQELAGFRVLSIRNTGFGGTIPLNSLIFEWLRESGLMNGSGNPLFYHNRPVLITRNDPSLTLNNGDIGITRRDETGKLRVYFPDAGNQTRSFIPAMLPESEPVFAMTVHKSQGSEFNTVCLVIPEGESRVLSRELIYTGITRVKKTLHIFADSETFTKGICRENTRHSGLRTRL